jgi:hypothetical protein
VRRNNKSQRERERDRERLKIKAEWGMGQFPQGFVIVARRGAIAYVSVPRRPWCRRLAKRAPRRRRRQCRSRAARSRRPPSCTTRPKAPVHM